MGGLVRQVFTSSGNTTIPANVSAVRVTTSQTLGSGPYFGANVLLIGSDGIVYAWGVNGGDVGNGTTAGVSSPTAIQNTTVFPPGTVNQLFVQNATYATPVGVLALTKAGDLYGWGGNSVGQLGIGTSSITSTPVICVAPLKFSEIFVSTNNSQNSCCFGLAPNGQLYGWGANTNGQLGNGNVLAQSSPALVLGGLSFTKIFTGGSTTTFGLTASGQAYAWGFNGSFGVCGTGVATTPNAYSSPVAVVGGLSFSTIIMDPTNDYTLGLTASGQLYAWGYNGTGSLGVGDLVNRSSPVLVLGGHTWQSVTAMWGSVIGITTSGQAFAWGSNPYGQLGIGNVTTVSSPVAVLGGLSFSQVVVGGNNLSAIYALGLTTTGAIYAWGGNTNGQLGTGGVVTVSSPVAVVGGLTFSNIYIQNNNNSSFATTASGQLYAWGNNASGQLGLASTTPQSSPVLVLGNHYPQTSLPQNVFTLPVVPGQTYAITLNQQNALFGSTPIGNMVSQVVVEYIQ